MSEPTRTAAPAGVFPAAQYTHVVAATGRLVVVSGQLPLDRNGELVGAGDPAAQARQVSANLRHCLAAAGVGFQDVVKLTYFVTDMAPPEFLLEVEAPPLPKSVGAPPAVVAE
ncbi:RidA family protein [Streptomyces sp. NPDC005890]|uniref:RidA family protein n=1 Tax=Streptomyces sp. NPDC005890 TaxID=3154568 RepID=UPI0033D11995